MDAGSFGPQVHPIHRLVRGLGLEEAARRAAQVFRVSACHPDDDPRAEELGFVVTDGVVAYRLDGADRSRLDPFLPADRSAAWRSLDVVAAHHALIAGVWSLPDTEEQVGYAHDRAEAVAAARREGALALLLRPTPVEAVSAVAASGERMPRKSTLFTPKPASGLVLRELRSD